MKGVVKFWNRNRSFGFVSSGGEDFYFNERDLLSPVIAKDDEVEFEPTPNRRGLHASFIQKIVPKRTFYNAGPVSTVQSNSVNSDPGTAQYFSGCIEKEIDGNTYLLIPLAEVCRHFQLEEKHFLTDMGLDILNKLQKQHKYPLLISL